MNLFGSYRALRNNSKAAMLAAVEIYNKPQMSYRDECFTILLVNAWELLLKAILSKNKQRIFYPKKQGEAYKTITLQDALSRAKDYFPIDISYEPVSQNLNLLIEYRNNAIHFYNQAGLNIIIYGLAQTCVVNYRDLMLAIFKVDISNEINIHLLPLSFGTQPDPIQFLRKAKADPPKSKFVADFLSSISTITQDLEAQHLDTSRFLTVFKVNFQSVKKVAAADVVIGVKEIPDDDSPVVVERRVDPNQSHRESQSSIVQKIGTQVNGAKFTTYTFQAIVWKLDIKDKPNLCWRAVNGAVTWYSTELISIIKRLSKEEIESAVNDYSKYQRARQKLKKKIVTS